MGVFPCFDQVKPIPNAKVPIVKFRVPEASIEGDISLYNPLVSIVDIITGTLKDFCNPYPNLENERLLESPISHNPRYPLCFSTSSVLVVAIFLYST